MTLGRLMELYQAEQQGKQIMVKIRDYGYYDTYTRIKEVSISDSDLEDLINNDEDRSCTYFIKDEEDEDDY